MGKGLDQTSRKPNTDASRDQHLQQICLYLTYSDRILPLAVYVCVLQTGRCGGREMDGGASIVWSSAVRRVVKPVPIGKKCLYSPVLGSGSSWPGGADTDGMEDIRCRGRTCSPWIHELLAKIRSSIDGTRSSMTPSLCSGSDC